ncbi:MAG TPA: GvpL/GvpF family gas vesicle protein [Gemmatimonadaceae bacterium]|nr:GvpL/GvpF family gas vesicle protein [Gemmatimonadaceae bacterium]
MTTDEHAEKEQVVYAYGVVSGTLDLSTAPRGVEGAAVVAVADGDLTALCSFVSGSDYTGEPIEARVGDVEWVGPRATAHDAVLTWASDRAEVIPFTMFTLFSGTDSVKDMLRERAAPLAKTLERLRGAREYTLRVYQSAAPADDAVQVESDPRIAELERLAAEATPGQRYLLERKLERARREERSRIGAVVAADVASTLAASSVDVVRSQLPSTPEPDAGGRAVLDTSFLVKLEKVDELRAALGALVARYEPRGFRFEFTGPWPAYHFARTSD